MALAARTGSEWGSVRTFAEKSAKVLCKNAQNQRCYVHLAAQQLATLHSMRDTAPVYAAQRGVNGRCCKRFLFVLRFPHDRSVTKYTVLNGVSPMQQLFIHAGHLSIMSKRYLDKQGLDAAYRTALEGDLLVIEGVLLNSTALDLNAYANGEWFNNHIPFLCRLSAHIKALAFAERNVALHTAIISERTSPRARQRLIRVWNSEDRA